MPKDFDRSDICDLDCTIADFILPRLKAFKKQKDTRPSSLTKKQWDAALQKMIDGFQDYVDGKSYTSPTTKSREGLELFVKWFDHLWY